MIDQLRYIEPAQTMRVLGYPRRDNCVCWVADVDAAQTLLDEQLRSS